MSWTTWPWPRSTDIWSIWYVLSHNGNAVLVAVMLGVHYLVGRLLGRATHLPPLPVAVLICGWELTFNGTLGVVKAVQGGRPEYLLYHLDYALVAVLCSGAAAVALTQEWRRRHNAAAPGTRGGADHDR